MWMLYKKINKKIVIKKDKKKFINCYTSCKMINKCSEVSTCEGATEFVLREMKEGRF